MNGKRSGSKRKQTVSSPVLAPPWQRWLGAIAFTLVGGSIGAWGAYDIVMWVGALRAGADTVETASALLGFAPIGFSIALTGPLLVISPADNGWSETVSELVVGAFFSLALAGVLLGSLGGFGVTAIMQHHGYRACKVWRGTRMSVTTWALRDRACPVLEQ